MGLYKIFKIVAMLLGFAGLIFWFLLISKGDDAVKATGAGVAPLLYIAYVIMAIVLGLVTVFVLKGVMSGDVKKTLISVGAFLAVLLISYVMASGSIEGLTPADKSEVTESTSKWVGTGLIAFYILAVVAVTTMAFSGVKKVITK
ncbi:MAG: hypothetical protein ABR84_03970 [Cryomorphaceae bacterium BACL21 MAG-121220-bin10]|jgi:hypothetical protein|nr:MAG: hypothetical protein ABR84_03970 [Cryomorphaceae bacterium BACL21 MAG-121220-bin10]|tara:strand:- start:29724 stop:30158 length:435 start_codon:yes stop_codon:yes gene_type:complete